MRTRKTQVNVRSKKDDRKDKEGGGYPSVIQRDVGIPEGAGAWTMRGGGEENGNLVVQLQENRRPEKKEGDRPGDTRRRAGTPHH